MSINSVWNCFCNQRFLSYGDVKIERGTQTPRRSVLTLLFSVRSERSSSFIAKSTQSSSLKEVLAESLAEASSIHNVVIELRKASDLHEQIQSLGTEWQFLRETFVKNSLREHSLVGVRVLVAGKQKVEGNSFFAPRVLRCKFGLLLRKILKKGKQRFSLEFLNILLLFSIGLIRGFSMPAPFLEAKGLRVGCDREYLKELSVLLYRTSCRRTSFYKALHHLDKSFNKAVRRVGSFLSNGGKSRINYLSKSQATKSKELIKALETVIPGEGRKALLVLVNDTFQ
ncbi:hypothetical protein [Chlamydiifrater phoenicopteri]|uniref:hypothetical protein n=1 Tax=Chlamydiifrater phoenicopteri TaxID=2681469 RepID=UPI001BD11DD3|nr:hypothetical protein [Chlamydiifrater phoenicopteri]